MATSMEMEQLVAASAVSPLSARDNPAADAVSTVGAGTESSKPAAAQRHLSKHNILTVGGSLKSWVRFPLYAMLRSIFAQWVIPLENADLKLSETADEKSAVDPIPNEAPSAIDTDAWSEAQVLALVQAVKAVPKDVNQRWERVAAAVQGKTVGQCKRKVVSMRSIFRTKKGAK